MNEAATSPHYNSTLSIHHHHHHFNTTLQHHPIRLLEQNEQEGHVVAADALGLGGVVGQAVVQQLAGDGRAVLAGVQARAHEVAL
jgi:hypothetical protein